MTQTRVTRVAFLVGHLHKGGMQKALSNISKALPEEVERWVVYFGGEEQSFDYHAGMVDLGVPGSPDLPFLTRLRNAVKRRALMQRFIDRNCIDVVVSFGEIANIINLMTKRKRTVLSVRVALDESLSEIGWLAPVVKGLIFARYRHADAIVPVSHALGEQLVESYGVPRAKVHVIPNLYDLEEVRALAAAPLSRDEAAIFAKRTVVTVGSLNFQKAHDYLIRSFARATTRVPDLQLVIVGRGEKESELANLAREVGFAHRIHFLGFQSNPHRLVARANVFALSSKYEGFPNALVEAMICGTPVVALDCPTGPREILGESEYGILLPAMLDPGQGPSEDLMADAIIDLLRPEQHERYRRLGLERSQYYERRRIVEGWCEVLGMGMPRRLEVRVT